LGLWGESRTLAFREQTSSARRITMKELRVVTPRAQRGEPGVGGKRFEYPHGALPTEDAHLRGARRASPFLPRLLEYPLPTSPKLRNGLRGRATCPPETVAPRQSSIGPHLVRVDVETPGWLQRAHPPGSWRSVHCMRKRYPSSVPVFGPLRLPCRSTPAIA